MMDRPPRDDTARLERELAAWRIFGRFLLDDVKDEATLRDAIDRIRNDVPRLLAGELISG